jgi:hypothetical protein
VKQVRSGYEQAKQSAKMRRAQVAQQREARRQSPVTVAKVLRPDERAAKDSARQEQRDSKREERRNSPRTVAKTLDKDERAAKDSARQEQRDSKREERRKSPRTVAKVLDPAERAASDAEREVKNQQRRDSPQTVAKVLNRKERAERESAKSESPAKAVNKVNNVTTSAPATNMPRIQSGQQKQTTGMMNAAVGKAVIALNQAANAS